MANQNKQHISFLTFCLFEFSGEESSGNNGRPGNNVIKLGYCLPLVEGSMSGTAEHTQAG